MRFRPSLVRTKRTSPETQLDLWYRLSLSLSHVSNVTLISVYVVNGYVSRRSAVTDKSYTISGHLGGLPCPEKMDKTQDRIDAVGPLV